MDHRAEALANLSAIEIPYGEPPELYASIALVHSQLAVADELKGIREEIERQGQGLDQAIRECTGNV